ncbi:hypothetical protein WR25_20983 [Diploscapter pachys]|uniref:Uncharacterized protein n=1 Tax=Diploscapter pachys TaxID=2018661 RepID=A0A2A2JX96_9BILA|nr:hypothetical protein WR25_20983 [Diploscapter pachys]
MTISSGADQMISSSPVEWSQFGRYSASSFVWRYFHANRTVSAITGTMISSIRPVDHRIRWACCRATSPAGFITTRSHPPKRAGARSARAAVRMRAARKDGRVRIVIRANPVRCTAK